MAGFEDQLIPFNPYISQIPVDDYTRIGLQKQQQYNQGVQQVQAYIDNVAGLDVIKPEQKDYLNQRISSLQSQSSKIASQDFSNQQVVNSVGMLTKEIANDPVVRNAVYSTQAYRAESAKMKTAQDQGKSSASNEYVFQRDVSSWLTDKSTTSAFTAQYTPYTDYKGKMVKALNDALGHPDEYIDEMPYKRDANGKTITDEHGQPVLDYGILQKTYKGVSADRIKNIIDSSLDENDHRQIGIDGQYEYRGYGKDQMKQLTDSSYKDRLDQVNSSIEGLMVERSKDTNNQEHIATVDAQIGRLKSMAQGYQSSYLRDIGSIDNNLEGFKGDLYRQNWQAKFDEGYSYAQNSLKFVDNPMYKAAQTDLENKIKLQEFLTNKQYESARLGIEQQRADAASLEADVRMYKETGQMSAALAKKMGKAGAGGADISLSNISTPEPIINPQDQPEDVAADWGKQIVSKNQEVETAKMALLASKFPELVTKTFDENGQNPGYEWNNKVTNPDGTTRSRTPQEMKEMQTHANAIIQSYKDGYDKGNTDPDIKYYFDKQGANEDLVNNMAATVKKANELADEHPNLNTSTLLKGISPLTVRSSTGNQYHYSPQELVDFNRKLANTRNPVVSGGTAYSVSNQPIYDDEKAAKYFTTAKDNFLYNLAKTGGKTPADKSVINTLDNINNKINVPNMRTFDKRTNFINNIMAGVTGVKEPVSTEIRDFKGTDIRAASGFASEIYSNIVSSGKGNTAFGTRGQSADSDLKDFGKMISEKNAKSTHYYLTNRGAGNFSLKMTNPDVNSAGVEAKLTTDQVNNIFGSQLGADTFEDIQTRLNMSKLDGKITTNVVGDGARTAMKLSTQNLKNYAIKYDVEDPNNIGQYQIKLYIHDRTTNEDKTKIINPGTLLNKESVVVALGALNDNTIKTMLTTQPTNGSPAN